MNENQALEHWFIFETEDKVKRVRPSGYSKLSSDKPTPISPYYVGWQLVSQAMRDINLDLNRQALIKLIGYGECHLNLEPFKARLRLRVSELLKQPEWIAKIEAAKAAIEKA